MTPDWTGAAKLADRVAAAWSGGPGGAIMLFDRDGIRGAACGGLASLEHAVPFTPDTPTRYASISKHVLATALLLAGVDLDAPLGTLLPGLPPVIGAVPLLRALTMTGGLPDMMELLWQTGLPFTATVTAEDVNAVLERVDSLCARPGTEMAYSNTGWRLGQAVMERRARMPYEELLNQRLFGPLDVSIVFPEDEAEPVDDLATGYWRHGRSHCRGRYGLHFSASGGLAGSAAALARWAAALLAGRRPLDGMLDRLLAPRPFADGTPSAYRLGLVTTQLGSTRVAAHSGSLPGYPNHLLLAPDRGVGVVLLMNRDEDPLLPALRVLAVLLDEPAPEPAECLPDGLYAEETGPAWAEMHPGAIEFMGGRETLAAAEDGTFRSLPSTLEVSLRQHGGALEGCIGGVRRRLLPVPGGLSVDPDLVGAWRAPAFGAELVIRPDGTALWPGRIAVDGPLTPLPGARALASLTHQMWRHRPCLALQPDGALLVASHRARVLRYVRA